MNTVVLLVCVKRLVQNWRVRDHCEAQQLIEVLTFSRKTFRIRSCKTVLSRLSSFVLRIFLMECQYLFYFKLGQLHLVMDFAKI